MSTDFVIISNRLREELDKHGYSLAAAARAAGEKDSERLKQVMNGRQRCPVDLLAALAVTGINLEYILTGRCEPAAPTSNHVVDVALVIRIASALETALTKYRARLAPAKKEELVKLLYEHFSAKGRFEEETIDRHLRLVINQ